MRLQGHERGPLQLDAELRGCHGSGGPGGGPHHPHQRRTLRLRGGHEGRVPSGGPAPKPRAAHVLRQLHHDLLLLLGRAAGGVSGGGRCGQRHVQAAVPRASLHHLRHHVETRLRLPGQVHVTHPGRITAGIPRAAGSGSTGQ